MIVDRQKPLRLFWSDSVSLVAPADRNRQRGISTFELHHLLETEYLALALMIQNEHIIGGADIGLDYHVIRN